MKNVLLENIIKEELINMRLNRKILVEHRKLISERKDWNSLVTEEFMKLERGEDFDRYLIEEGIWDKLKYYVGKLGSLEKGGKVFGDRKMRNIAALDKVNAALEKASSDTVKTLKDNIEEKYPEFPNMESKEEFLNALLDIGTAYDSIEAAVSKGKFEAKAANEMVQALREYVTYILDYQLSDVYKHFTEGKRTQQKLGEAVQQVTPTSPPARRRPRLTSRKDSIAGKGGSPEDPGTPQGRFTRRGAKGGAVDSETLKGLDSNTAPLILGALGALGGGFGWLVKQGWFIKSLTPAAIRTVWLPVLKGAKMGVTQGLAILNGTPTANLSTMTLSNFVSDMTKHGLVSSAGTPTKKLLNMAASAGNSNFANWWTTNGLNDLATNGTKTLGELIPASGSGAAGAGGDIFTQQVVKVLKTKVASSVAGGTATAMAGQMAAAGTLASTLGIGLVTAGAAVKLIRMKGKKSSRAQLLRDLSTELQSFEAPEPTEPTSPEIPTSPTGETPTPAAGGRGDIYVFRGKKGKGIQSQLAKLGIKGRTMSNILKALRDDLTSAGFNVLEEAKRETISLQKTLGALEQMQSAGDVTPDQVEKFKNILVQLLRSNRVRVDPDSSKKLMGSKTNTPSEKSSGKSDTDTKEADNTKTSKTDTTNETPSNGSEEEKKKFYDYGKQVSGFFIGSIISLKRVADQGYGAGLDEKGDIKLDSGVKRPSFIKDNATEQQKENLKQFIAGIEAGNKEIKQSTAGTEEGNGETMKLSNRTMRLKENESKTINHWKILAGIKKSVL